jgi:Flp pilus assembly protein CpaB
VTQLTVQDAVVLNVGDWTDKREKEEPTPSGEEAQGEPGDEQPTPTPKPEVRPLTIAVTPQDALVLKYSQELGANITLVLRSVADADKAIDTESVTLRYLFEQFNVEQPPKLPYGITPPLQSLEPGSSGGAGAQGGGSESQ